MEISSVVPRTSVAERLDDSTEQASLLQE